MNSKVKKYIYFRFDRYKDVERKLEELAQKGLFLSKCGPFLWEFEKGTPRNLKYAIAFFKEGSVFEPNITNNQQAYFDYAKEAGWNFVSEHNKIHIFCSEIDNLIPFETDERERLRNIQKSMNKSFLPSTIALILIFLFNLFVQINSFIFSPIDFLSDSQRLFSFSLIFLVTVFEIYTLADYLIWCSLSKKSINTGGLCVKRKTINKLIDVIFIILIVGCFMGIILDLSTKISYFGIFIASIQVPILIIMFWSSIKYLKKKKVSSRINKIVSYGLLIILNLGYLTLVTVLISNTEFISKDIKNYSTSNVVSNDKMAANYKFYNHDIPLRCEDLYEGLRIDDYSYKKEFDKTFLLTKHNYTQSSLQKKDTLPEIEYEILTSKFNFVNKLVKKDFLTIPSWQENLKFHHMSNEIFKTIEAFEQHYNGEPTGTYILVWKEKVIKLNMEEPITQDQIKIIKEKLKI